VKRPPKGNGRTQYLQKEEVGRLLDACPPHLRPIVLCVVEPGMRKSEILGLRWSEVREVTFEDKYGNKMFAPMIFLPKERTKTRTARVVPISSALNAELKRLKEEQHLNEAETFPKVVTIHGLVFRLPRPRKALGRDKTKLHLVTGLMKDIRGAWDAAKVKAGISPEIHFHDLRRTFRTRMKRAHVDSFILNEVMGHANPKIEETYTQINYAQLVEAISLLPDWNSHKTSTSVAGQEKGLRAEYPQSLDFTGAEGGI
jgi:integrase